jgi:hypothetical protein
MKRYLIFLLIITLIGANCSVIEPVADVATDYAFYKAATSGKTNRGATMMIQTNDRQELIGELIVVKKKDNSLSLYNEDIGEIVIAIMDIKTIFIFKKTKATVGAIIGFLTFFAISYPYLSSLEPFESIAAAQAVAMAATLFWISGGLFGYVIGASFEDFEVIQLEGKSNAEINMIMENLRKKARVPEFH